MANGSSKGFKPIQCFLRGRSDALGRFIKIESARRSVPESETKSYSSLKHIEDNPNLDFRLTIHDPLIRLAEGLVAKHGDKYEEALKSIDGKRFKSNLRLLLEGIIGGKSPAALTVVSAGAGGALVSWIISLTPLASRMGRSVEFRDWKKGRQVRHLYFRLLEKFSEQIVGSTGTYLSVKFYNDIIWPEALRQFTWDERVAEDASWSQLPPTTRSAGYGTPPPTASLSKNSEPVNQPDTDSAESTRTMGATLLSDLGTWLETAEGASTDSNRVTTAVSAPASQLEEEFEGWLGGGTEAGLEDHARTDSSLDSQTRQFEQFKEGLSGLAATGVQWQLPGTEHNDAWVRDVQEGGRSWLANQEHEDEAWLAEATELWRNNAQGDDQNLVADLDTWMKSGSESQLTYLEQQLRDQQDWTERQLQKQQASLAETWLEAWRNEARDDSPDFTREPVDTLRNFEQWLERRGQQPGFEQGTEMAYLDQAKAAQQTWRDQWMQQEKEAWNDQKAQVQDWIGRSLADLGEGRLDLDGFRDSFMQQRLHWQQDWQQQRQLGWEDWQSQKQAWANEWNQHPHGWQDMFNT